MRGRWGAGVAVFLTLSSAAYADTITDCREAARSETRISACTEIIKSADFGPDQKVAAYISRGEGHRDAGAIRSALDDFNEAIRLRPDNGSAFAGRARVKFIGRNWIGAMADYSDAIRLSPSSADFYVERAHVYVVVRKINDAITDLTEAIRLDPEGVRAFDERGLAYFKKGDLARAQEDFTAAIARFPAPQLYANRGEVYLTEGRTQDAINDFRLALLGDPSLVRIRNALKRLGAEPAVASETEKRIREGEDLATRQCGGCHGVAAKGFSPNKDAPEFRNIYRRHALFQLRQPITRAVQASHAQMPQFQLSAEEMNSIVAYINSLSEPSAER